MEATDAEADIAKRYLDGELTEVQFNYLVHNCGSTKERMECILEEMSAMLPLATAAKFLALCMMIHFAACVVYSLATFYRGN